MRRKALPGWMRVGLMAVFFTAFAHLAAAAENTVVGQVNDNYQIVSKSQIYEIGDTEKGNDLAQNHVGAKVQVTGTVEERDDMKIVTVTSYKVLSE